MADIDPGQLRRVTVFSALTEDQLRPLAQAAAVTEHESGEALTEEGVLGHRFHLVLEGTAEVERGGRTVATLAPGEFVGEIGLLGGGPSTATVRATSPIRCMTLRREDFWAVLEEEPSIALRILEVVCRRIQEQFQPDPRGNLRDAGA